MNQIIFNKKVNKKIRTIFIIQFIISVIMASLFSILIYSKIKNNAELEKVSYVISSKIKLESFYNTEKVDSNNIYFGKIYIRKINLEYIVFDMINEELLKIAPCRFFGSKMGEKGNICIAGHNYNNNSFFSRLDELEVADEILLEDLKGNKYVYKIFSIYEIDESDMSILLNTSEYELTLLTCNNSNKKRIIVKASLF